MVGNGRYGAPRQSKTQSKYQPESTVQSMSPVQSPQSRFCTYPPTGIARAPWQARQVRISLAHSFYNIICIIWKSTAAVLLLAGYTEYSGKYAREVVTSVGDFCALPDQEIVCCSYEGDMLWRRYKIGTLVTLSINWKCQCTCRIRDSMIPGCMHDHAETLVPPIPYH